MKCPNCKTELKEVKVSVEGATEDVISFQCQRCEYVEFEQESANKVISELKIAQIIKLL